MHLIDLVVVIQSSDATPNIAIIGSSCISFSQIYENVLNTGDQYGPRNGHVQNIWPKVASPLWHLEHVGSISGNIVASLLLEKCSLWIILNCSCPCWTQIDAEWICLTADCQTVSGTILLKSSSHCFFKKSKDGEATLWIRLCTADIRPHSDTQVKELLDPTMRRSRKGIKIFFD